MIKIPFQASQCSLQSGTVNFHDWMCHEAVTSKFRVIVELFILYHHIFI